MNPESLRENPGENESTKSWDSLGDVPFNSAQQKLDELNAENIRKENEINEQANAEEEKYNNASFAEKREMKKAGYGPDDIDTMRHAQLAVNRDEYREKLDEINDEYFANGGVAQNGGAGMDYVENVDKARAMAEAEDKVREKFANDEKNQYELGGHYSTDQLRQDVSKLRKDTLEGDYDRKEKLTYLGYADEYEGLADKMDAKIDEAAEQAAKKYDQQN